MPSSTQRSITVYGLKKFAILFFFIAYFLVQCAGTQTPRREYFPVFSWSLFSSVSNPWAALEIEILRVGETIFPEPVNYFELDQHFEPARRRSTDATKSAARMLWALKRDPSAAERAREAFEQTFLGGHDRVEYQLVGVRFDPLERWRSGALIERRVLERFSTEDSR